MKRIGNDAMFFWFFITIAVINMKSSFALKQNEFDKISGDDLVADEGKEKDDEPKMEEMSMHEYKLN